MKILRLDLRAFGPFTDEVLDLADGSEGFHVVYGPNEAGKSSALRALRSFFYGIETRSADNFLHPHPKMRIAATLRAADGRVLELVRRKGNRGTLRDADDDAAVDESTLTRFWRGSMRHRSGGAMASATTIWCKAGGTSSPAAAI